MEGLTHLVAESLARNGVETSLDHRRLQWSKWFRCESSFSVLLAPSKPGVFALGEEIVPPGQTAATSGKRMLGLFRIAEAEDLGMALDACSCRAIPSAKSFPPDTASSAMP